MSKTKSQAALFAALGDENRLHLVKTLAEGTALSITQLSEDANISRQAITKHLHILEEAGIVHNIKAGRESLFELKSEKLDEMKIYLDKISAQWDKSLLSLKKFLNE